MTDHTDCLRLERAADLQVGDTLVNSTHQYWWVVIGKDEQNMYTVFRNEQGEYTRGIAPYDPAMRGLCIWRTNT